MVWIVYGDGGDVDDSDQQTAHFDDAFVLGDTSVGSSNGQHTKHVIRSNLPPKEDAYYISECSTWASMRTTTYVLSQYLQRILMLERERHQLQEVR